MPEVEGTNNEPEVTKDPALPDEPHKVDTSRFFHQPKEGEGPDFSNLLPEEFKSKPYMKDIDSMDKLLKQFDNAQSLIGKKTLGIPGEDASAEEWNEFYTKMGRPESPDKYEFESVEMPEGAARSEEQTNALKKIFHEAGLTPKQANLVLKKSDEMVKEQYEQMKERGASEFNQMLDKYFGPEKEKAIQIADGLMQKYVPKGLEDAVKGLDDQSMMILATVLNNVYKDGKVEDAISKTNVEPSGLTKEDLRKKAQSMMRSESWKDIFHPEHERTKKEVRQIYQQIARQGS